MEEVGFIDAETYAIYDGANINNQCKEINKAQFSYNNGVFAQGAAFMFNYVRLAPDRGAPVADPCPRPTENKSGKTGPRGSSSVVSRPFSPMASPSSRRARTSTRARQT